MYFPNLIRDSHFSRDKFLIGRHNQHLLIQPINKDTKWQFLTSHLQLTPIPNSPTFSRQGDPTITTIASQICSITQHPLNVSSILHQQAITPQFGPLPNNPLLPTPVHSTLTSCISNPPSPPSSCTLYWILIFKLSLLVSMN